MPDAPRQLPPKKEVALALLEGPSLFVHLDPRREGVLVPKWFVGQPQLVLQVGLNMAIPIPDLKVDDDGVSCTLSFQRTPFWCRLPWSAIYALVGEDGRGMVWPQDVPPEVATQMQKQQALPAKGAAAKKSKPKLNAVESPPDHDGAASGPKPRSPSGPDPARASDATPARGRKARDEAKADRHARSEGSDAKDPKSPRVQRVPPPATAPEVTGTSEEGPTPAARPSPVRAPSDAPPSEGPGSAGKKPKRELPPYLRVIK